MSDVEKIIELTNTLNKYRDSYYNNNLSLVSDEQYDNLFDDLQKLEDNCNFVMANSPTKTVGYVVQDKLKKVKHNHPMLSLGKTKDVNDIIKFASKNPILIMLKLDGISNSLSYDSNGDLISAETRGDGDIGENVFENIKTIKNVPLKINNNGVPLIVDGEIIIDYEEFERINDGLSADLKYSHTRNLASGSLRQLDSKITASRNLKFVAWKCISGIESNDFCCQLDTLGELGFEVVPHCMWKSNKTEENFLKFISTFQEIAKTLKYPIDGLVLNYSDVEYCNSLGSTSHHPLAGIAFKFYDEVFETNLTRIIWETGRTGILSPVAVFDTVDLDGALTSRATLHNVSIIKKLQLGLGDKITVFRANQVIPKIDENLTCSNSYIFPTECPSCGAKLEIVKENDTENLYCPNEICPSRMLNKFVHFTSKSAMAIDGLSEATLEKLIGEGFIHSYKDIYHLNKHENDIVNMEGFGQKSYNKLMGSIEKSRKIKLENFLVALGIDNIGRTASKVLSKEFNGDFNNILTACKTNYDFTKLNDFGKVMEDSIYKWYYDYINSQDILALNLVDELNFIIEESTEVNNDFINGKTFCVTGAFFIKKRSEIETIISDRGGKLSGSVSSKTAFLLSNEENSNSSKTLKAKELSVPIMSEKDFLEKIGIDFGEKHE